MSSWLEALMTAMAVLITLSSVLLAIGGFGYVANIFANAIPIAIAKQIFPYIMYPAGLAELALSLWLIVFGVNIAKWRAAAG